MIWMSITFYSAYSIVPSFDYSKHRIIWIKYVNLHWLPEEGLQQNLILNNSSTHTCNSPSVYTARLPASCLINFFLDVVIASSFSNFCTRMLFDFLQAQLYSIITWLLVLSGSLYSSALRRTSLNDPICSDFKILQNDTRYKIPQ